MDQTDGWLVLNGSGLTPRRQRQLIERFGEPLNALAVEDAELQQTQALTIEHVRQLRRAQQELDLPRLRQKLTDLSISLLPITDPLYPRLLTESADPPPLLFLDGEITKRDEMAVAIVGTRLCTPYGQLAARRLGRELAQRGFTIVSGLALGIDAEAHEGALEAGGRTLGIMASGPDTTYPPSHKNLRQRMKHCGGAVTEYAFGSPPLRERFPSRNRIIAGMTLGTLVIEAPIKSGALITANLAAEYGREVMAVPGSIESPVSHGCHDLIKNGARLIEVVEDVVEALGIMLEAVPAQRPKTPTHVSSDEQTVLDALSFQPRHVDEVATQTELPVSRINSALMLLEMKTLVRRFPGSTYVRL
ncbi:MAG: DNA-processing protein DprA [Bacteroidota bacterium]